MTLSELALFVCNKLGKTDSVSLARAKDFIKARHRMIYDGQLWRESLVQYSATAASGTIVLPWNIERVVAVRWSDRELPPIDQQTVFQIDPQAFDRTGTPCTFSYLPPVANFKPVNTTTSSTFTVISDDASDTATIRFSGTLSTSNDGGVVPSSFSATLNGTTPVNLLPLLTGDYDSFSYIGRATNTSLITIRQDSIVVSEIFQNEEQAKYLRIRLLESPNDVTKTILVLGKQKFQGMNSDADSPIIPRNIDNALIAFGLADMLERNRQYQKAQDKVAEAGQLLDQAKRLETSEGAANPRFIPYVGESIGFNFDTELADVKNP